MLGQAGLTAASADWADGEHVQQRNVVESELVGCGVAQAVALRHRRCSHRPVGGHIRAVGLAVADDLRIGFSLSQLGKLLAKLLTYVAALSPPLAAGLGDTGAALAVEYVGTAAGVAPWATVQAASDSAAAAAVRRIRIRR
jgi:hypothetical protein